MRYNSTIEYLFGLQKHGMKFGIDNISRLMSALGDPQKSFRTVHVAGTNGKGSTSAMIESIVRTGGIKTGLFTSPHLVSFTERIRINGKEISEEEVIRLADEVRDAAERIEDFSPTFFEVVTAMAFVHFRNMKIDCAVVEAGMGGRLDATNIITPEASVITSIDLDHREFLGQTLREIAGEKAGIIKQNVPVVTAGQHPEVMEVIEQKAANAGSELHRFGHEFSVVASKENPDETCFSYHGSRNYSDIKLPLSGRHQIINASLAVKTVEVISDRFAGIIFDIQGGLKNLQWQGRLEMIKNNPPILIDGAHNPSASIALSEYLQKLLGLKYKRLILVLGIMKDKDIEGILKPLLPLSSEIIFTSPAYERAASPDALAEYANSIGYFSRKTISVNDALSLAENLYIPGDLIAVTGSFYTIGEAKEAVAHKGVLARLRE